MQLHHTHITYLLAQDTFENKRVPLNNYCGLPLRGIKKLDGLLDE